VAADLAAATQQVRGRSHPAPASTLPPDHRIQGGDPRVVDDYARLPHVADRHVVAASRAVRDRG